MNWLEKTFLVSLIILSAILGIITGWQYGSTAGIVNGCGCFVIGGLTLAKIMRNGGLPVSH